MTTALVDGLVIRPIAVPTRIDADDAADFCASVEVRNIVLGEVAGHDDHRLAPAELLPMYQPDPHERRLLWLIELDGRAVGRAGLELPLEPGSRVAFWFVELRRDVWGRGVGSAAYDLVERTARAEGRTVLQCWAEHPPADGDRIAPPTGFGDIPDDHIARFLRHRGFTLEQIERNSAFDLHGSFAAVDRLLAEARTAAAGYEVVRWFLPTPPDLVEGYAWMKSRMVTDAPSAALEFDEEVWDAARLARHDADYLDGGRTLMVTAARHVATGELCAFNELVIGTDRTVATEQADTLVLAGHRGHRLGALVKCDALRAWRDVAPDSPRVLTYNAEENRPMLDINEAIGFVPIAYEGAWKKVLDD